MATVTTPGPGGPQGPRRGTALSPQDVKALFELMSQVVLVGAQRDPR